METNGIWRRSLSVAEINSLVKGTMVSHLGMTCIALGDDTVTATMPVDGRTTQPYGLLHGGASATLAETLASISATLALEENQVAVGVEINASHIRQVRSGVVTGVARPLHIGRRIHLWQVEITDDAERLVCVSRVTLTVLERTEVEG